jgi:hypothetical protein
MCCGGVKKTIKTVGKITTGYAYLMFGVNEELSKQRMKICRNCPKFKNPSCTLCGCEMAAKTRLPQESCSDTKNPRWLRTA